MRRTNHTTPIGGAISGTDKLPAGRIDRAARVRSYTDSILAKSGETAITELGSQKRPIDAS
jgi:hypothetical protein